MCCEVNLFVWFNRIFWRDATISPRKRSPRNAKNKYGMRSCPVIVGNEYEVDISQMSPNGDGIARVKGFLVLIENTQLGEHLKVKITNLNPISAEAEIINHI